MSLLFCNSRGAEYDAALFCDGHKSNLTAPSTYGATKMQRSDANHKANQSNPNNPAYRQVNDNRSNQGNPNNPVYRSSRSMPPAPKK